MRNYSIAFSLIDVSLPINMYLQIQSLSLLLSFLCFSSSASFAFPSASQPHHFLKPPRSSLLPRQHHSSSLSLYPREYTEITEPLPSDHLFPSCSHSLLVHSFNDTMGKPPVTVPYKPARSSDCPSSPWSYVVLQLDVDCRGKQYDRIAGVWLGGVEILRTSTAEPNDYEIFWKVRKDVTRYSSLFDREDLHLSMMLENAVDSVLTGAYHVNLTLLFYKGFGARVRPARGSGIRMFGHDHGTDDLGGLDSGVRQEMESGAEVSLNLYPKPADVIIPVSNDAPEEGLWFRIQNEFDVHSKSIEIPRNVRRIVLELYVSYHGDDEFWYTNPPNIYIKSNNLTTKRGNGAYREVFFKIDGRHVASDIPFPVIFTGGINPSFWEPVVSIGAFNLPSHDFDLTPFVALLLDGKKTHKFELGVLNALQFWLVDANLHIWLDHGSSQTEAKLVTHQPPKFREVCRWGFKGLDGSFQVKAKRKSVTTGWVATSYDNLTTTVTQKMKFKNLITIGGNGNDKMVTQRVKVKTAVRISYASGDLVSLGKLKRIYPFVIRTKTLPRPGQDTYLMIANVSHSLSERSSDGNSWSRVYNYQDSDGSMLVNNHNVLSGSATTRQNFNYEDQSSCYSRDVVSVNGYLFRDDSTTICSYPLYKVDHKPLIQSF